MASRTPRRLAPLAVIALLIGLLSPTAVLAVDVDLIAELNGTAEVPGPGDPDGGGFANVFVSTDDGALCYFIEFADLDTVVAAHIHEGAAGASGPPVVTLDHVPNADGALEGCLDTVDAAVLAAIAADPGAYYVNLHTDAYPDGAIRGQLAVPPPSLFAELSGAAEVPGPGHPEGAGFFSGSFDATSGEICHFIEVSSIDTAVAAHIHEGAADAAGPVVVTLATPGADGVAEACVTADPAVVAAILADPAGFYVNVHTGTFPQGAVRGQLLTEPPEPPVENCTPPETCSGIAAPGVYVHDDWGPALQFELFSELPLTDYDELGFDIFPDPDAAIFAITYHGEVWDPCFTETSELGGGAAEVAAWLEDHPNLGSGTATQVTFAGVPAWQIDTVASEPADCADAPPFLALFGIPTFGDFHFDFGEADRIWIMDVEGTTFIILIGSLSDDLAGAIDRLGAITDSMLWLAAGPPAGTPAGSVRPAPSLSDTAATGASGTTAPQLPIALLTGLTVVSLAGLALARHRPNRRTDG